MATAYSIEVVRRTPALLGESPVWSEREQALYWVDIHGCAIHRFDPASGADEQWNVAENVGSLGLRSSGGAVVALRSGFHLFDFATGRSSPIANPIAGTRNLRFNDGRCDRQGRFWSGTVNEKREPGTAAIYRLDAQLECTPVIEGITVANTIAWSPQGTRMSCCPEMRARWSRRRAIVVVQHSAKSCMAVDRSVASCGCRRRPE